jgi:hypothetical protein
MPPFRFRISESGLRKAAKKLFFVDLFLYSCFPNLLALLGFLVSRLFVREKKNAGRRGDRHLVDSKD